MSPVTKRTVAVWSVRRLAANLSDPAIWAEGDEHLIDNITNGVVGDIGAMPAQKGVLSETEIQNVYAYIKETYKK